MALSTLKYNHFLGNLALENETIFQREESKLFFRLGSLSKRNYFPGKDTRVALLSWKSLQKLAGNLPVGTFQWM